MDTAGIVFRDHSPLRESAFPVPCPQSLVSSPSSPSPAPTVSQSTARSASESADGTSGTCRLTEEIFSSADASAYGFPVKCAPLESASYSRVRETHNWISIAASGASSSMSSPPIPPPLRRPPPNQNAIRARIVIAPASVAAIELVKISRLRTWLNSCASTPSSSSSVSSARIPCVTATEACFGFRPVANAFGDSVGMT